MEGGGLFDDILSREQAPPEPTVYTVAEITRRLKRLIEGAYGDLAVNGEISNFRRAPSGHLYFTLKDADAQLSAVMFRGEAQRLTAPVEEGLSVVATGRLSVYAPRGNYQIIVRTIEIKGAGALEAAFRALVDKLAKEGLFDPERKRPIPEFPRRIGIVTSPSSAAVIDMLRVFARRFPNVHVTLFPVSVQGAAAKSEIVAAIEHANGFEDIDVLIVGRGGGSLEDLWAFNEEIVARAIVASRIPVVSGVGHEVDVTIADLAADLRAATPTAAAELVVPREADLAERLTRLRDRLGTALAHRVAFAQARLDGLARAVRAETLLREMETHEQRIDDLFTIAKGALRSGHALADRRLEGLKGKLESLDPLAVLARGYSVTTDADTGAILRDAGALSEGQRMRTRLARGSVLSSVSQTHVEKEGAHGRSEAKDV